MTQPTALGVYIFAGGFTLGVRKHFNVLAHFEDGPFGTATVRHNMPELPIFTSPDTWPIEDYAGVPLIYGNPPCAPWSNSARSWKKTKANGFMETDRYDRDPRTSCVFRQFELLGKLRPRIWTWESVMGAWTKGRPMVEQLARRAHDDGYSTTVVLENGAHLGLPQQRRRFFCVFHDIKIDWQYPTEHVTKTVREALAPYDFSTAWAYPANEGTKRLLEHVQPGEGLRHAWEKRNPEPRERNERGHVKGRPNFSSFRLKWDQVCPTMIGGAHMFHPDEARHMSVKEMQVLTGYPYEYEFKGNGGDMYAQIAKAVTPPVGEWFASNARRAIDEDFRTTLPVMPTIHLHDFMNNRHESLQLSEAA